MPFGVIRLRNEHASWVKHRRYERQVLVHAAHERGGPRRRDQWVEDEGEECPGPRGVLELALHRRPVDALHAVEGDADGEEHADQHPDVQEAEPLDLERRDVLGAGRSREVGAERLQHLALVLDALGEPRGQGGRLHDGDDRAARSLPSTPIIAAMARSSPTSCGGQHEERSVVAVVPVLLAAGVGGAEVVERDLAVSPTSTRRPSRLPCATPALCRRSSCCHAAVSTASVTCSGGSAPIGAPAGGVVTSTAASAPPTPVRTSRAARTSARSASISVKAMCSTCWIRLPNTGTPGVVVHRLVPDLRGDAGIALVAPERVDPEVLAGRELDVHHRRARDVFGRRRDARDVVAEVGERVPHLGDRRLTTRGAEHHPDQRRDRETDEEPAEHVGREAGTEVHRRRAHEQDDDGEDPPQWAHENGDNPNASAVMMATLTTGKAGPSPRRMLTLRPLMSWVPSSSLRSSAIPHATAAASAPCHAARTCRATSSTTVTARAAQIEPSA